MPSPALPAAAAPPPRRGRRLRWARALHSRRAWAWVFCLPAVACTLLVAGWPLLRTVYLSFTDANLARLDEARWIGADNYAYLLRDPDWWRAVWNTLVFTTLSVSIETALGLGIALLLHARFRARGLLRAAVLVPWAIPTVVSAKMWGWMLNDQYGVVNALLLRSGLLHTHLPWLADDRLALVAVVAVDVWKTTPFLALLLLAGLQGIPSSLYEAAALDGSSAWQTFRRITLPHLRPALLVGVIFRTLDSLRIFDLVYILSSNSKSMAVMSVYARQQMVDFQEFGFGSAAACVIFALIALLTVVYLSVSRKYLDLRV